jgi:hypothetical protein
MLGRLLAPSTGIPMLKVPSRPSRRSETLGVKLTVSRVSEGAIEVAISTPGRLKIGKPSEKGGATRQRATIGTATTRVKKIGRT